MGWIRSWRERRAYSSANEDFAGYLNALVGADGITPELALQIPAVAGCVEFISGMISGLPVRLLQETYGAVEEVKDDRRVQLLNDSTGDLLSGQQLKKAIVRDMLLGGCGYIYKNMRGNRVQSLHYVRRADVSVTTGADPIFKTARILVNGREYRDFSFIKVTRNTVDGVTGRGIVHENARMLALAYNSIVYENTLVRTGGNKRGFLKSSKPLTEPALRELKEGFKKMYTNTDTGVIVLNSGVEFEQASSTSVEMQLRENKEQNGIELCKLFCMSPAVLSGAASEVEFQNSIKTAVMPVVSAFEAALNRDLLLESEKQSLFYAFDTVDIIKGDIEKLYRAYSEAVKAGWITKNEIRYRENLTQIDGLDVVSMSLGDVIFDIHSGKYFTPNKGDILAVGGGETDGSGNQVGQGNS